MSFGWFLVLGFVGASAMAQSVSTVTPHAPPPPPPLIKLQKEDSGRARVLSHGVSAEPELYSIGQPTDEEQYYLELINRARANPAAEGILLADTTDLAVRSAYDYFNVDLNLMKSAFASIAPSPPLAMNGKLAQAARLHSQEMLVYAYQNHEGRDKSTPSSRVTATGYTATALGENIYSFAESVWHGHAGFEVDWGIGPGGMQSPPGHRNTIHSSEFREVGIGVVNGRNTIGTSTVGPQLVTQEFATSSEVGAFVTGVVYFDLNGNNFYDPGEGIGGVTVNVEGSNHYAITANSGGYAVPVPPQTADREVTFAGLGITGNATAVITGGKNVKVDLTPAYVPATPAGPSIVSTSGYGTFTFNEVKGASGYEWRWTRAVPVPDDNADSLARVTPKVSASYSPVSTAVKHEGTGAYHLVTPSAGSQTLTYKTSFLVGNTGSLSFRSRLRYATGNQVAKVQVSTDDGVTWEDVYSQAGSGGSGEATFLQHNISLAAYAGKDILLRFNYVVAAGSYYNQTGNEFGWFVDAIKFSDIRDTSDFAVASVPAGTHEFEFAPPSAGEFLISVRPVISGRSWQFGPTTSVTGVVGPHEIGVQLAPSTQLTDGVSTVPFGTVRLNESRDVIFNIVSEGLDDLSDLSLSIDGVHADDFTASELEVTSLPAGGSTSFTVTFAPSAPGIRQAVLRITSNDANENPFDITLAGIGDSVPVLTEIPQSLMKVAGEKAEFHVTASPLPLNYQWLRGKTKVGTNSSKLTIDPVRLADAGEYTVMVTGSSTVKSDPPAQLGVVENFPKTVVMSASGKGTVTFACKAAGNNLTYQWYKGAQELDASVDGRLSNTASSGPTRPTLTLKGALTTDDTGTYTCRVSGPGGTVEGGTVYLRVYDSPPDLDVVAFESDITGMPQGIVGGTYSYQIPVDPDPNKTPVSFSASGLPPGLKLDAKTGVISGRPTKAGNYDVTVSAINALTTALTKKSATKRVVIAPFPANVDGVYTGIVEREAEINGASLNVGSLIISNGGLGGRIDFTITKQGSLSGSVVLGSAKYAFKGAVEVDVNQVLLPSAVVEIKRGNSLPPLTLQFEIEGYDQPEPKVMLKEGTAKITLGSPVTNTALIRKGWRQVKPVTEYAGYYTLGLRLSDVYPEPTDRKVPQGWGYAAFTVAQATGKFSFAGVTADGEKLTTSSFIGPNGEMFIHQVLYKSAVKGSLTGLMDIALNALGDTRDNTLTGQLNWVRPPDTAAKARTYKAGFGSTVAIPAPVPLMAVGGRYGPLEKDELILNLNEPGPVKLTFAGSAIDEMTPAFDPAFDQFLITDKNKVPPTSAPIDAKTKLSVNSSKGTFSGSFTLKDANPRDVAPTPVARNVKFQGMLINDGVSMKGHGFFLLPQLPKVSPETPTTTEILSGAVHLQP